MSEEIKITGSFVWTFEDVKAREDALASIGPQQRFIIFLPLIIAIIIFALVITRITRSPSGLIPFLIPVVLMLGVFFIIQTGIRKKTFMQSPDNNKRVNVLFTKDEIAMTVEGAYETKWKWNVIKGVQQDSKGFFFFIAEKTGFWVPIRTFQSEEDIASVAELAKQLTPSFKVLS